MNTKGLIVPIAGFFRKLYSGPWYKKVAVWFATFILIVILFFVAVDCNFCYLFGRSPGFADIEDPVVNEASEVYTCDGVLMGRYFNENRTPVTYKEISPILIRTLIDTEDERFYLHNGIDVVGLFSAGRDIVQGHARGASTITQQLAKNLFRVRTKYSTGILGRIPGIKILVMKAKEWIVALKLEWIFSKEEILTMYLNTVDFGSNAYGIKTAGELISAQLQMLLPTSRPQPWLDCSKRLAIIVLDLILKTVYNVEIQSCNSSMPIRRTAPATPTTSSWSSPSPP